MSPATDWGILLLVGFLSHVLILFNDGRYWDSWIISAWQMTRDDKSMERFYREVGMPVWYYLHRFMGRLPNFLYWYNLLTFVCLLVNPILVFEICRHSTFLSHDESLFIACLATALPLPQMVVDYIVGLHYVCPVTLFYTAWLLALPTLPMHSFVGLQFLACVLFFLSFNMNSLLMFYGWFYLATFLIQYHMDGDFSLSYCFHYGLHTLHLLLLPPLFWILKRKVTPTSGAYADYNQLKLPPFGQLVQKLSDLYTTALFQIPADAFAYVLKTPLIFLGLYTVVGLSYFKIQWGHREIMAPGPEHCVLLLGFGLIGLALAGIPYLLVSQIFGNRGWITKNNTLLGVPAACVLIGLLGLLVKPFFLPLVLLVLVGVFVCYWNFSYLQWFTVAAKNNAIIHHLGKIPDIQRYSVLGLWDRHFISGGSNDHPEHGHGCSTLSFMLSFVTKQTPFCIGIPDDGGKILASDGGTYSLKRVEDLVRLSTIDYGFTGIDLAGPQALVIIDTYLDRRSTEIMALLFIRARFFRRHRLDGFYHNLIKLEFIPLPKGK